ncbi:MAG: S24/S26 family peptidase [Patescibacteria group bacterium]
MIPVLKPGRIILASPRCRNLRPDDVVIIWHGGMEKIKRIQKSNGDQIFVVGDNSGRSTDSRTFGWLPVSAVRAKVVWPAKARRRIMENI